MNESLQRQVCFSLYSASRAATALYRPMLEELKLTYPQFLVMTLLWEQDGQSVSDLGQSLELDSGTLSPLLKRLEAAQLLQRRRAVEDERRVRVYLTDAGRALEQKSHDLPDRVAASAGLDPEELRSLQETLAKVNAALRQSVAKAQQSIHPNS
ncbi:MULTISPECIES: MarR family winged helix-turn-helix transcriptional regulator [unclassified Arthrobacter]|uniref:MarR family winged helix-turn-helix transcriptional regulator n=1 Tax=unclassified Arthrobacter TaxID=235627 RepID=UPI001D14C340|nr:MULTISPECIES: MarR family transcriptional regulator [unclassified Arthrobacter]MCC3274851.1 MarR family transcriptional regulator [Arthrobacter sp. zg-Y20]MCC9177555.1 MarR family transcriptional regulator [Arthrobacter sp. zg-Y750]MDK1315007.1 MarR family transcriptional regulator [Arthrobacter sp. zg.Y20]WIB04857.1 MarR family transcriptional regulator [Arthrobacter sp. zg-Y20]